MHLEVVMKAVLALIVIYIGAFFLAIQGTSSASVEASGQSHYRCAIRFGEVQEPLILPKLPIFTRFSNLSAPVTRFRNLSI